LNHKRKLVSPLCPIAAITMPECAVIRILKSKAWLALMTPAPVSSPMPEH